MDLRILSQRAGRLSRLPIGRWPKWAWAILALTLLAAAALPALVATPFQPAAPLPAQGELAASQAPGSQAISTLALSLGVLFKLGIVVLLIYVSLHVLKRWGFGAAPGPQKRLAVLETARLSPRQSLHLVRVGEQTLLIGATDQAIALISQVESLPVEAPEAGLPVKTLPGSANSRPEGNSAAGFAALLVNALCKR